MSLASPNDQKYPRYLLVLKFNVTLAWPLRLVILDFFKKLNGNSCQIISACMFMSRSDVDGLTAKFIVHSIFVKHYYIQSNEIQKNID